MLISQIPWEKTGRDWLPFPCHSPSPGNSIIRAWCSSLHSSHLNALPSTQRTLKYASKNTIQARTPQSRGEERLVTDGLTSLESHSSGTDPCREGGAHLTWKTSTGLESYWSPACDSYTWREVHRLFPGGVMSSTTWQTNLESGEVLSKWLSVEEASRVRWLLEHQSPCPSVSPVILFSHFRMRGAWVDRNWIRDHPPARFS